MVVLESPEGPDMNLVENPVALYHDIQAITLHVATGKNAASSKHCFGITQTLLQRCEGCRPPAPPPMTSLNNDAKYGLKFWSAIW